MATEKQHDEKRDAGKDLGRKQIADEIAGNIKKIAAIEEAQKLNRTFGEKLADRIASFFGSMIFVYVHVCWFTVWILINTVLLRKPFDPYPFTFLTFVVSLEAIFLSTFILITQNHEKKISDRRNQLDLQINMLAEQENTKTLEMLHLIADKIGVQYSDTEAEVFLEAADPEEMVEEIVKAIGDRPEELEPPPDAEI